jgi:hypothetical protein
MVRTRRNASTNQPKGLRVQVLVHHHATTQTILLEIFPDESSEVLPLRQKQTSPDDQCGIVLRQPLTTYNVDQKDLSE